MFFQLLIKVRCILLNMVTALPVVPSITSTHFLSTYVLPPEYFYTLNQELIKYFSTTIFTNILGDTPARFYCSVLSYMGRSQIQRQIDFYLIRIERPINYATSKTWILLDMDILLRIKNWFPYQFVYGCWILESRIRRKFFNQCNGPRILNGPLYFSYLTEIDLV